MILYVIIFFLLVYTGKGMCVCKHAVSVKLVNVNLNRN